jgi:hypothetical protein
LKSPLPVSILVPSGGLLSNGSESVGRWAGKVSFNVFAESAALLLSSPLPQDEITAIIDIANKNNHFMINDF